jgi:hypothetical protein
VEIFLRRQGFLFHRFHLTNTRTVRPMLVNNDIYAGLSQLLAADSVFIRDLTRLDLLSDEQLLKMGKIMHDCYGSFDVVLHLLTEFDRRSGKELSAAYLRGLQG